MKSRARSMDSLRSVAILLVILAHTVLSYGAPEHLAPLQLGGTGVDLFFVLSGWLLGGLLFREAAKNGRIDIKRFWMRRWMRTLPAYYAVLFVSIGQRYLTRENVAFPWEFLVFFQNYDAPIKFFSVSWSLCVEEQFYLLIAPLLGLLTRTSRRTTTVCLLSLLLLPFVFRELLWYRSYYETHVRLDCCVAGVFLAHVHHQYKHLWARLTGLAPHMAVAALLAYGLFFVARYNRAWGIPDPDKLLLAVIFGAFVLVANASDLWRDRLYFPGAYYIATRSYALYLLHPEVLALLRRFGTGIPFVPYFAIAVVGSLTISEVLYRCVEKPTMDSRERFAFSRSGKKDTRQDTHVRTPVETFQ